MGSTDQYVSNTGHHVVAVPRSLTTRLSPVDIELPIDAVDARASAQGSRGGLIDVSVRGREGGDGSSRGAAARGTGGGGARELFVHDGLTASV